MKIAILMITALVTGCAGAGVKSGKAETEKYDPIKLRIITQYPEHVKGSVRDVANYILETTQGTHRVYRLDLTTDARILDAELSPEANHAGTMTLFEALDQVTGSDVVVRPRVDAKGQGWVRLARKGEPEPRSVVKANKTSPAKPRERVALKGVPK